MNYDAIIIGAGLGGLTTGATLVKKGKKVLVLEQHIIPGGAATIFERKGIKFEVGLHEMDWGTPDRDMKALIFRKLGILDTLPMVTLPQVWRIKTESKEYTIPHGRENVINYLSEQFPSEAKGIKKYFAAMKEITTINRALPNDLNPIQFFLFPILVLPSIIKGMIQKSNVGDKLDKFIKSDTLKNILNVNIVYYSDNPYEFAWDYHAAAQYSYYNSGVYIKGGSQVLSNQLADVITNNGGEIRYLADVQKIEMEGNKAIGITYQDRKSKEMITVYGKKIVANCSPENVYNGTMVPSKFQEPKVKDLKDACSLWSIYIIFKEPLSKKYPGMAYSTFLGSEEYLNGGQKVLHKTLTECPIEDRPFVLVDYSTIDSGLVPENDSRGFGVLCGNSYLSEWEMSTEEYKTKKEQFAKHLFSRLEKTYPGITDNIEYFEVSTPKTVQRYLKTPSGTAYGYRQKGYSKWNRAPFKSSQIKNLHFTGAWSYPGGGFTGAIICGYHTAIDMLLSMKARLIIGTILCTISGTAISMFITKVLLGH